jgi:hypothetical protein
MTIILANQTVPEKGHLEFTVSVDIAITAQEAHYKVRWWLRENISMLVDADPPTLVIGTQTMWRVPAYIAFPSAGKFSDIGFVQVDATTGELLNLEDAKQAILDYLEKEVKPKMPQTFTPLNVPDEFIPKHLPSAPKLTPP